MEIVDINHLNILFGYNKIESNLKLFVFDYRKPCFMYLNHRIENTDTL